MFVRKCLNKICTSHIIAKEGAGVYVTHDQHDKELCKKALEIKSVCWMSYDTIKTQLD